MSKVIDLSTDTTASDMAGQPKPLEPEGSVTIVGLTDNPDETVQLGKDFVDDNGVEVSKEVEAEFDNTPPPVIPIPSKTGQESE